MKKLSIIVPVYNEIKTIESILKTLKELPLPKGFKKEVIVVNDNSNDGSERIIKKFNKLRNFQIVNNKRNLGKTGTVKAGILKSTGDFVVVQDADNEYEPLDLIHMIQVFLDDTRIDAVYGNRFNKRNVNKGINHLGNRFLTAISNFFTIPQGVYVKDMEVCYKMIKGPLFRNIARTFESTRFGLEPETTAKLAKSRAKVVSIDIHYFPRGNNEGKKLNAIEDGIKALKEIIRFNAMSVEFANTVFATNKD